MKNVFPDMSIARLALFLLLTSSVLPSHAAQNIRVVGLFKDTAVVEIDGGQHILKPGRAAVDGVRLISATSREAVIEINGKQGRYTLGTHISAKYRKDTREQKSVAIWPDRSGMYRTVGSINGYPVNFLVDTGATLIAMNSAQAKRMGIDFRVVGKPSAANTASGVVRTWLVTLKRVKVGDIELSNVKASVINGSHPVDILLGMSFLGKLELNRDGKRMELRTRGY